MVISDLIDYLGEFPADTRVVLSADDIEEPCEFIALDVLDYTNQEA